MCLGEEVRVNVLKEEDIFDKYKSCFEGLGKLKDFQLDIPIDQNVKPVAQPMRRVPFSMREKLEQKPSSETQGQLVGAGKSPNGRGKKSGEEKSRTKIGAPGILLLTDQFRNHLKSLPVIGHKNIFVQVQKTDVWSQLCT